MPSKTLTLNPILEYDTVSYSKASEVHLDVLISAPEKEDQKRIPLHLILAIDCSGSMAGSKLTSVKNTVNKLIDNVTENDTLGIIGFSGDTWDVIPTLPMTSENKKTAKDAVNALATVNMTNLEGAILCAIERAVIADKNKVCRVVVLTDGLPTAGNCDKEYLVELVGKASSTISMSAFGYGSDYDPELLTSLSSIGRGNLFYIKEEDDCKRAFALELGGLLSLSAQNIRVSLSPAGQMVIKEFMSGFTVKEEAGYRGITPKKFSYEIDDIYYGEHKHAILKMVIPEASEAVCARPVTVCKIEIEYTDVESKEKVTLEGSAKIQYVKSKEGATQNEEIRKQLALLEIARIQKEAKEKADKGDFKTAQTILGNGVTWLNDGAIQVSLGAPGVLAARKSFEQMAAGLTDNFTYHTTGSKLAGAYLKTYSMGRAASYDTMNLCSMSDAQNVMMKSFMAPTVDPGVMPGDPDLKFTTTNPDPDVFKLMGNPNLNEPK